MKPKKGALILTLSLTTLFLAGCGGSGGGGQAATTATPAAAGPGAVRMAGHVEDENGNPVAGVEVAISGTQTATTDGNGDFTASVAAPGADGTSVRLALRKAGYIETFKNLTVTPDNIDKSIYSATLKIVRGPATPAEATFAEITLQDGSTRSVTPQADSTGGITVYTTTVNITGSERAVSFATPKAGGAPVDVTFTVGSADGSGANAAAVLGKTGNITGSVTYGNPTDQAALETFPGDFTTKSDMGDGGSGEGSLITAGFVRITLRDADGQPITKFADGQTAKIKMNVPVDVVNPETGAIIKAGDTIPVFIFNEDTSEWIVEHNADGSVKRTTVQPDGSGNLFVQFETSHLTWFNLDWRGELCPDNEPVITLADSLGKPVNGATLYFYAPSGWAHYPAFIYNNKVSIALAPKNIEWRVWAGKDGLKTETATINACRDVTLVFKSEQPKPKCSSNADCDDGNSLTMDKCAMPGDANAVCVNFSCSPLCASDSSCGDGDALTTDTCVNAGTCNAYCARSTCQTACSNHSDCADSNPDTTNKCVSGGTCAASCASYEASCGLKLDKVNYAPGETMQITFTGNNAGPDPVMCGAASALKRGQSPAIWNSFDENLFVTIPANTTAFTRTITKTVPAEWILTTSNQGSDYDIYAIHTDGAFWAKGDNFNIHVDKSCGVACSTNAACDDGDPMTTDSCVSPGSCGSNCSHNTCPVACAAGPDCDDGNPLTTDVCNSPGTCSASCASAACDPACSSAANCDDNNALTTDSCLNPDTCAAACSHSACSPACINNSNCDDNNALTLDTCANPDTCAASCSNAACVPACSSNAQCDDNIPATFDICANPDTCSAACVNTLAQNISPTVTISQDVNFGPAPLGANFAGGCADPDGVCVSYLWDFGDGSATSTAQNTSHTFTAPGMYPITLTVEDNMGATAQLVTSVTVYPNQPPVAAASPASATGTAPYTASFTGTCSDPDGSCDSYSWNFGDGSATATTQNATHTFTTAGTYNVTLTVTDNGGATAQSSSEITVNPNQPPAAAASPAAATGTTPLTVNFTGSCSDPDGSCVSYLWNFGDGSAPSSTQNPAHIFTASGTYNVTLTVTDNNGATSQSVTAITAIYINHPPTATVSPASATGTAPFTVNFTGSCADADGVCVSYLWNFGDGSATSTVQNPTHTFSSVGTYSVALTATDNEGATAQSAATITVNPNQPPTATATANISTGGAPLSVNFTAICADPDGSCVSYLWNFGDGSPTNNSQNPSHTYSGAGTYTVTLTVTDNSGATGQSAITVTTYQGPSGSITASVSSGAAPLAVDFTSTCVDDGYCASYQWDFGDGSPTSSLQNPSHTFTNTGAYNVTLTLTDNDGHTKVVNTGVLSGGHAVKITAGSMYTCAITPIGGVKCWGQNASGQLGNGTSSSTSAPVNVSGLTSGVISISGGGAHTCALTSGGGVTCWGDNTYGKLGDGTTAYRYTPIDVIGLTSGVIAIVTGYHNTCALTSGGGVKCWGYNYFGQLGDGTTTDSLTPVDVSGLTSGVVAIASDWSHTCALTSGGGVKCWGYNAYGELGDGTTTNKLTPVDVSGLTSGVAAISTGMSHTCALTFDGGVKCWGGNNFGQLGDGTTTNKLTPVDVSGLTGGVAAISTGRTHTCALTTGGGVKCWGWNYYGELGDGVHTLQRETPVDVTGLTSGVIEISDGAYSDHTCAMMSDGGIKCWGRNNYGQIGNGIVQGDTMKTATDTALTSGVSFITAGTSHSCAIVSGALDCWGLNDKGQIGDGTLIDRGAPIAVTGLSSGVTNASAGSYHTCAVASGGVKCWGQNTNGQLGNGTTLSTSLPVNVSGLTSGITAVTAGAYNSCALTSGGGVKCWGFNTNGQLGNATNTGSNVPVDVTGLTSGVIEIGENDSFTCALTTGGGVKCWGTNYYGQLGNGTTVNSNVPVDVTGLTSGVAAIAIGASHACALTVGGGIICWGLNSSGQLGDGTFTNRTTPVNVTGFTNGVVSIAYGKYQMCAVTAAGALKCWGYNTYGQLGDGTTTYRKTPIDVTGLTSGVVSAAGGSEFTCAFTISGGVKCWGRNDKGQLGLLGNDTTVPNNVIGF